MDPTLENLHSIIARYAAVPAVTERGAETLGSLGIDSLDLVDLLMTCEELFTIVMPDHIAGAITLRSTVAALYDAILAAQELVPA